MLTLHAGSVMHDDDTPIWEAALHCTCRRAPKSPQGTQGRQESVVWDRKTV